MRAALTAAFTTLALAAPAQAYHIDPAHHQVLSTVQQLGIRVYVDPVKCSEGMAGYYNGSTLGLCTENSLDHADYLNTIRHEAVHVAQRCKSIATESADDLVVISDKVAKLGLRRYPKTVSQYHISQWGTEAEAWMAADALSPQQVESLLRKQCSFAF